MAVSYSPLRYPGGKSRLTNFMKLVIEENYLKKGVYMEPFAGGAGVALGLLLDNYVDEIFINDIDPTVFSFWYSVLNFTDELIHLIENTSISMDEWYKQKQIFTECDTSQPLFLGFATFFLNRTNRSGILSAGVVGGKNQTGEWKLDARFPKESLIKKIQHIGKYRHKITLCNLDARVFILKFAKKLQKNSLIYLDPPYFHKGQKLYLNALRPDDHILIAHCIANHIDAHWITSYDNTHEISSLYSNYRQASYNLNYTAANRYHGSEIIIYSHGLKIPSVENPFRLSKEKLIALL